MRTAIILYIITVIRNCKKKQSRKDFYKNQVTITFEYTIENKNLETPSLAAAVAIFQA